MPKVEPRAKVRQKLKSNSSLSKMKMIPSRVPKHGMLLTRNPSKNKVHIVSQV